jgi:anti-sigma B factor antagonist
MPGQFEIAEEMRTDAVGLLRVTGRLDAKSAPLLTQRCSSYRVDGKDLILNLAGVSFVASSGLGSLLSLAEEFHQAGCSLRLACPSTAVLSVIRLLNLDQFLAIDLTEEDSIHALRS